MPIETQILVFIFTVTTLVINHCYRGTRIHLWPLIFGFFLHSISFIYDIFNDLTFYTYYLTVLASLMMVYFFGSVENYQSFVPYGRHAVGCVETVTKVTGNRVLIYYPTPKNTDKKYRDMLWAYDGDHMVKGLMKFAADLVPSGPFYYLLSVKQKVRVGAPIVKPEADDKHKGKFVPIIMTHGVGNTMTWFSTICKDFAS